MNLCQYCGTNPVDTTWNPDSPHCSECASIHKKMKKHGERATDRGLPYERFTPLEIFERDGWVCWICFESVDPTLKYRGGKGDMSASLDHVIPLAANVRFHPGHVPTNCQLAHWQCNVDRKDTLSEDTAYYCCPGMYRISKHSPRCDAVETG